MGSAADFVSQQYPILRDRSPHSGSRDWIPFLAPALHVPRLVSLPHNSVGRLLPNNLGGRPVTSRPCLWLMMGTRSWPDELRE